jgi:hypothetical protein
MLRLVRATWSKLATASHSWPVTSARVGLSPGAASRAVSAADHCDCACCQKCDDVHPLDSSDASTVPAGELLSRFPHLSVMVLRRVQAYGPEVAGLGS